MTNLRKRLALLIVAALALPTVPLAAQATRTFVSGVGNDADPCSRTAPCKTFSGALGKTAAGGEINCLDPGGYGALTITKSITIDCTGTYGSALSSSVTGFTINAAGISVILRGISINGAPPTLPGTHGIRFLQGSSLLVENVTIQGFTAASPNGFGISMVPSTAAELVVTNTTIANNGTASAGGGINIQPTGAGGSARVSLRDVRIVNNRINGIRVDTTGNTSPTGILLMVDNVLLSGNSTGINVNTPVGTTNAQVIVTGTTFDNNSGTALGANGAASTMIVGTSRIFANGFGVSATGGAAILTYEDNNLSLNVNNGAFTGVAPKT